MLTSKFPLLGQWLDKFMDIANEVGWLTTVIGVLTGAVGVKLIAAIAGVFGSLTKLLALIATNPILLAITLISGAAFLLYEYWDEVAAFFKDTWDTIVGYFDAGVDQIMEVVDRVQGAWDDLTGIFDTEAVKDTWVTIVGYFDAGVDQIMEVVDRVQGAWDDLTGIFDAGMGTVKDAWDELIGLFDAGSALINDAIETIIGIMPDLVEREIGDRDRDDSVDDTSPGR